MKLLNSGYLKFYIIATSSVVLLFSVVTAYGEQNLNPPPRIGGLYNVESTSLPDCLKDQQLQLTIQQSGVYISGSLQANRDRSENKSASQRNLPLKGRWQDGRFSIAGAVSNIEGCDRTLPLTITAKVTDKKLAGELTVLNQSSNFTAQLQEPVRKPNTSH